jgi:hypothetical protein
MEPITIDKRIRTSFGKDGRDQKRMSIEVGSTFCRIIVPSKRMTTVQMMNFGLAQKAFFDR